MMPNEYNINPTKVRPIGDRVLVRHEKPPTKSPSGLLHIPESAQKKTYEGRVLAVGDRMKDPVVEGDLVTWETFSGADLGKDESGAKYIMLRESELMAVVG